MQVKQIMTRGVECAEPSTSLHDAAAKMKSLDVGLLPVCDNGRLVGILSDRDITIRATAESVPPGLGRVEDVMTRNVYFCFDDQDISEAAELMKKYQVRRLPVLDHDKEMVGIVSLGDLAVDGGDEHVAAETLEFLSGHDR